jgi:branched-chain amino acid transport system permease protein
MPFRESTGMARRIADLSRWRLNELLFWTVALMGILLFPDRYLLMTEIAWLALFVLSLDLILGYAGIISLGHAAFFGVGAYTAGLLALHGIIKEPVLALVAAGLAAMVLGFVTSFLVMRGADLSRLMVTLGIALLLRELANRFSDITGGFDGLQGIVMEPVLGLFEFDIFGKTGFVYCLVVLFVMFLAARRIVNSPFGLSLRAIRNNPLRAAAIGIPVNRRLIAIYTIAAFYAGLAGALSTQSTALASLDVFSFERSADLLLVLVIGGTGYLYGGLIGAVVFKLLQDVLASWTPQYWQFWIGLILVILVLIGRERMHRWVTWLPDRIQGLREARAKGASGAANKVVKRLRRKKSGDLIP